MKPRLFFLALFFVALSFPASAQEASALRTISKSDNLALQKGELENFKYQLKRFHAAIEDADQESLVAMHEVLSDLMERECEQARAAGSESFSKLKPLAKHLTNFDFSVQDVETPAFKESVQMLDDFKQLMQKELVSLEEGAKN